MPTVLKSGSNNHLEPSKAVQACNGIDLSLPESVFVQNGRKTEADYSLFLSLAENIKISETAPLGFFKMLNSASHGASVSSCKVNLKVLMC